tara:strand:- start:196 stop:477 length:282 start_codon:yes stop_codon:yes gene_type:complete
MLNLNDIKNVIESLPHYQQLLLIEHIMQHNIKFTENKNGIFLDISMLDDHQVKIIESFISKIKNEEEKFNAVEIQKEELKKQLDLQCNIANET